LANQEATEAERVLLHHKRKAVDCPCPVEYVDGLKEFILFMRCAVLRNRISKDKYQKLFHSYLNSVSCPSPNGVRHNQTSTSVLPQQPNT